MVHFSCNIQEKQLLKSGNKKYAREGLRMSNEGEQNVTHLITVNASEKKTVFLYIFAPIKADGLTYFLMRRPNLQQSRKVHEGCLKCLIFFPQTFFSESI